MKIISLNFKGLASPHKKSSLKHLVLRIGPDVLFLQETLGSSEEIKDSLQSLLPRWELLVLDARGRSRSLAADSHNASYHLSNSWKCESCLGTYLYSQELNSEFRLFNAHGPYQNMVAF